MGLILLLQILKTEDFLLHQAFCFLFLFALLFTRKSRMRLRLHHPIECGLIFNLSKKTMTDLVIAIEQPFHSPIDREQ